MAIATLTGKPVTIYGNGKEVRGVLYISNLVDAFDCFPSSELRHDVFNIGCGLSVLMRTKKREHGCWIVESFNLRPPSILATPCSAGFGQNP